MALPQIITDWFGKRGWAPRRHQMEMLEQADAGHHALLVASTGAGKTLAGFLPTLADFTDGQSHDGLHTLYISPLKALAHDVQR
ncbi:MAG: DEAD/DEAH box helicase, partial [Blastomonas fulva]